MALAFFVNRAGNMALPFLMIYLTKQLGFSAATAGTLVSFYGIGALVIAPVSGWLSDRFGEKKIMLGSLFSSGVLLLFYPYAKTYLSLLLLTLAWAVSVESFRPAAFSYLAEIVTPKDRRSAYALCRLAINLGMSFGPAFGGFLATQSFFTLFWVDGLTTITAGIVIALGISPIVKPTGTEHHGFFIHSFLVALRNRPLVYLVIALIPIMLVFFQNDSSVPLFITRDLKLKEATYGLIFTLNTILIILFELPLIHATRHWPHHKSLSWGACFTSLGFGMMAFCDSFEKVMLTVVVWTLGEMLLFPALNTYVAEIAPSGRRGSFMALYNAGFSICQILAPTLGALVWQGFGAKVLWLFCWGIGMLSGLLFWFCRANHNAMENVTASPA